MAVIFFGWLISATFLLVQEKDENFLKSRRRSRKTNNFSFKIYRQKKTLGKKERKKEKKKVIQIVCLCVCVRKRDKERERQRERQTERHTRRE